MEKKDCTDTSTLLSGYNLTTDPPPYSNRLTIHRPIYSQHSFDLYYGTGDVDVTWTTKLKMMISNIRENYLTKNELKNTFHGKFPFILMMMNYKWKDWFLDDLIAGIIVGIMNILQGMAYSQLARLRPVYGLYVSIFPALVYFFFGTSKDISIGTMAIASLMTGKFLEKSLIAFPITNVHNYTSNISIHDSFQISMAERAAGFALLIGIFQLLMGILNLGSLTRYLSDPMISGFTVGASMHVFTSQIKYCFGVDIPIFHGMFNIIYTFYEICLVIPQTNIPTFVLTTVCIILLIITKKIINPILLRSIKFPIPMELLVVIGGILVSKWFSLHGRHKVEIVGHIANELPEPAIPDMSHAFHYVAYILKTAIIVFTVSVSLAKMFSKKQAYKIDSNQELLAYGIMNIVSSFFLCFPSAASLSRSAVQHSVGCRTQLTSIFSSFLVILTLLLIGPLFVLLPNCILSAIILVSLMGMFQQMGELKELWFFSFWDFNTWFTTFLTTVLLDVEYGLIIGIILSTMSIVLRTQAPASLILGRIPKTDIYRNTFEYHQSIEIPRIKIFRYEGSLYYACCEHFINSLYSKVNCNPREVQLQLLDLEKKLKKVENKFKKDPEDTGLMTQEKFLKMEIENIIQSNLFSIIIDCSTWAFIDIVGVKTLNQIIAEFNSINIAVLLANPKDDVRKMFHKVLNADQIDDKNVYITVHDAVMSCMNQE